MARVRRDKFNELEERVERLEQIVSEYVTERHLAISESGEPEVAPTQVEEPEILSFDDLGLAPNAKKAFESAGVRDLHEALALSDDELLSIKGIGPSTVEKLRS